MDNCELVFLFLTRGLYAVFVGVALAAVPEAFDLLQDGFRSSGSTLHVPLEICRPNIIEVDGTSYRIEQGDNNNNGCLSLDLLVSACCASFVISIAAVAIFLGVDCFTRCQKHNTHRSMVMGMGLFLCFILLQAGFCAGSLAREAEFIEDLYSDYLDAAGDAVPWSTARTYGSVQLLKATMVLAFVSSLVVLVESIYIIVWVSKKKNKRTKVVAFSTRADASLTPNNNNNNKTLPTATMPHHHSLDVVEESPTVGPTKKSESDDSPSWSNVL